MVATNSTLYVANRHIDMLRRFDCSTMYGEQNADKSFEKSLWSRRSWQVVRALLLWQPQYLTCCNDVAVIVRELPTNASVIVLTNMRQVLCSSFSCGFLVKKQRIESKRVFVNFVHGGKSSGAYRGLGGKSVLFFFGKTFRSVTCLTVVLRSEIPSGICAKLRTVAASNNRVQQPRSLYYCLFAPHVCMVLFFTHIPFVVNHTFNSTPPERLQQLH